MRIQFFFSNLFDVSVKKILNWCEKQGVQDINY